jgi:hypothetical protein
LHVSMKAAHKWRLIHSTSTAKHSGEIDGSLTKKEGQR